MKSRMTGRVSASLVLATGSFLLGGAVLPHVRVSWVAGAPAAAQPAAIPLSVNNWVRTQPVAMAAEKGAPAVVNIDTISSVKQSFGFFGEYTRMVPEKGAGSGVIISPDGYILTNDHVIDGANRISVTLANGKTLAGRLVGADHMTDIAVVKIPGGNYPAAVMGDSSKLRPGEWAVAEGNPLGMFSHTVSFGVVSALGRKLTIGDRTYEDLLQTDAAINPGNSGGPLLDINGSVIGINAATMSSAQGISFAIPINTARSIADQLIKDGKIKRAWSGLELTTISPEVADTYGIDIHGAIVGAVDPDSPADSIGFERGDIIRKVDGRTVESSDWLRNYLNRQAVGSVHTILVERGDEQQSIQMKLAEEP